MPWSFSSNSALNLCQRREQGFRVMHSLLKVGAPMSPRYRRLLLVAVDALLFIICWVLAYSLRFEFSIPSNDSIVNGENYALQLKQLFPWVIATHIALYWIFHLYRGMLRYSGTTELRGIAIASGIHFGIWALFNLFLNTQSQFGYMPQRMLDASADPPLLEVIRIPWSVLAFYTLAAICATGGFRFSGRIFREASGRTEREIAPGALLVGAGDLADNALRQLVRGSSSIAFRPICAVSTDARRVGVRIHGIPVVGTIEKISEVIEENKIELVLIALDDQSPEILRNVVQACEQAEVRFRIVPSMDDIAGGRVEIGTREIQIEDLLGREPVHLELAEELNYLQNERVMISGAGGSIGSELARQVALSRASEIILLGKGENSIYEIQQEIATKFPGIPTQAIIADIRDADRLEWVFATTHPAVVFHAAAHKHVPLMEAAPDEAAKNNILGTANIAELSHRYAVKNFVLISTDKAVSPTSVMGATKRLAEAVVFSRAQDSGTCFQIVRFGNVLGSRGSVIPQFRRQIAAGGPVTVTHPDVTRYFMTIPEAVSLVIQAGSRKEHGSLYILDMGKPVKILELARNMIVLSGLRPGVDINIDYIGMRPGEKLHEDLLTKTEESQGTEIEKLYMARPPQPYSWAEVQAMLRRISQLADECNTTKLLALLRELVPDYHPTTILETPEPVFRREAAPAEVAPTAPPPPSADEEVEAQAAEVAAEPAAVEEPKREQPIVEPEMPDLFGALDEEGEESDSEEQSEAASDDPEVEPEAEVAPEEPVAVAKERPVPPPREVLEAESAARVIDAPEEEEDELEREVAPEAEPEPQPDPEPVAAPAPAPPPAPQRQLSPMEKQLLHCWELGDRGEWREAVEKLRLLSRHFPQNVQVLNQLGWSMLESGSETEAFNTWKQSYLIDPNNPHTREFTSRGHLRCGRVYRERRVFDKALMHFKQLQRDEPQSVRVRFETAGTYALKGDKRHAIIEYEEALKLDPENEVALGAIAAIKDDLWMPEDFIPEDDQEEGSGEVAPPEHLETIEEPVAEVAPEVLPESDEPIVEEVAPEPEPESEPEPEPEPIVEEVPAPEPPEPVAVQPTPQVVESDWPEEDGTARGTCFIVRIPEGQDPESVSELIAEMKQNVCTDGDELVCISGEAERIALPADQAVVITDERGNGALIAEAMEYLENAAVVITLSSRVKFFPSALREIREALADENTVAVYGNYRVGEGANAREVELLDHENCFHERFDFGAVIAYKGTTLRQIGGIREDLNWAWEYDLHLRLLDVGGFHRIKSALYQYMEPTGVSRSAALHSPGAGPLGGFSYAFYPPEVEEEVTAVFEGFLRRCGAWMELPEAEVAHGDREYEVMASVVMPVLNRAKFVGNAIESVLVQEFDKEFEIVVVDNGSTDGTVAAVEKLAERDERVRLVRGTGGSIATAINDGIRAARGKYICQLDSDDEYVKDTLRRMVDALEKNPRCGLAVSYYRLMDAEGKVIEDMEPVTHSGYSRNQILRRDGAGATRVFPKVVLEEFGLYDAEHYGNFGEDYDMVLKVTEKYQLCRVKEVLYHYRRHDDNTDVTREPLLKFRNKNRSRHEALNRRIEANPQGDE